MKWYSMNNEKGCVSVKTIKGFENNDNDFYVWLIIVDPESGSINF